MKKILIFGASGLLGNAMYKYLSADKHFDVYGTINRDLEQLSKDQKIFRLNILNYSEILKIIEKIRPDWIINCIADIRVNPDDLTKYFFINSLFPQLLDYYRSDFNYRLIHISSNGVFSGDKNQSYDSSDNPDAKDVYGISKILSERVNNLVIRTSIIGHSLNNDAGLLDWFLNTKEKAVSGYAKVYWNGVATLTLAKIVGRIIQKNIILDNHIVQIASEKLSKYELIKLFKNIYNTKTQINREDDNISNKTLNPSREQRIYFDDLIIPLANQIKELKHFYKK